METIAIIEDDIYIGDMLTEILERKGYCVIRAYLDSNAINRILSNIINNAIKYSDGDLFVIMDNSGKIVFSNTAHNLNSVTVGKLFDRFYTVETSRNSTGLGLSIAKILTEKLTGKSRPNIKTVC